MNEILRGTKNRVENDFYATHPKHVEEIVKILGIDYPSFNKYILEPCAGNGHISEVLAQYQRVYSNDLIQREYKLQSNKDFLTEEIKYIHPAYGVEVKFDYVITNPPFKYAKEFVEKSLEYAPKVVIFARLQFLETEKRKELHNKYLTQVYVYSKRAKVAKNEEEEDFNTSSSMAYAWFIFDKNKTDHEIIGLDFI